MTRVGEKRSRTVVTSRKPVVWRAGVVFLLATGLSAWICSQWGGMEDAYITYQYAHRLAAGEGFTFSPGAPPTYGTTTPLWTLVLAVLAKVGAPPHVAAVVVGSLLHGLTAAAVTVVGAELLGAAGGLLAGLLCAGSLAVFFLTGGMEIGLFTFLSALIALAGLRGEASRRWRASEGVLLGLLVLTRPDALLLIAPVIALRAVEDRKQGALLLAATLLVYLPWAGYAIATFGDLVPFSIRAKYAVVGGSGQMHLQTFLDQYVALGRWSPVIFWLAVAIACAGAARGWRERPRFRAFVIWAPVHYIVLAKVGRAPDFPWYYTPPLWVGYVLVTSGVQGLARFAPTRQRAPALAGLAVVVLAVFGACNWNAVKPLLQRNPYLYFHKMLADRVIALSRPGDLVASEEVGNVAYWSGRPILDLRALTSPEVLAMARARNFGGMIGYWKPDVVLLLDCEHEPELRNNYEIRERYVYWNGMYYNIYVRKAVSSPVPDTQR